MRKEKKNVFEMESIPQAVLMLALPSVLSMLVTVLYNMADTVFVGQTHDPYQMNAVSLATPMFTMLMAFGNLFGIGEAHQFVWLLGCFAAGRTGNAADDAGM